VRKPEKVEIVQEIQEKLARAKISILADFTGLKVDDMTRLRRQIKEAQGEIKVVKNTLLTRAAEQEPSVAPLSPQFVGPNALALGYGDPVTLAQVLVKYAQERPLLKVRGGVLAGQLLSVQEIDALSKLPPREVLLAQFLGVLHGMPTALVRVLAGVIQGLLQVLTALKDKKAEAGEA
jgi:large subunit ribosomal protein L10